jgi:hypothetical protein
MPPRSEPSTDSPQLDLFPVVALIERIDPRVVGGRQTRVSAAYRVRYSVNSPAHQVMHDRHGWYCDVHGPTCRAVRDVTERGGAQHEAHVSR